MTRRSGAPGPWGLAFALIALALVAHADDAPAPPPPPVPKFSHETHAKLPGQKLADCSTCHQAQADGSPAKPGAVGHKPCMTSGCHLEKGAKGGGFLDKNPRLCLGCHESGANFKKNPASRVFKDNPKPEHFVEFDHAAHMDRKGPDGSAGNLCTNCHWIDKTTFRAVANPGHPQCAQCHGKEGGMAKCATCHQEGAKAAHFAKPRAGVRMKKGAFSHEHVGHRFYDRDRKEKPIQCSTCHPKVEKVTTLRDLKSLRLVSGGTMQNVCAKCHDVISGNLCNLCHTDDVKGTNGSFHFLME